MKNFTVKINNNIEKKTRSLLYQINLMKYRKYPITKI